MIRLFAASKTMESMARVLSIFETDFFRTRENSKRISNKTTNWRSWRPRSSKRLWTIWNEGALEPNFSVRPVESDCDGIWIKVKEKTIYSYYLLKGSSTLVLFSFNFSQKLIFTQADLISDYMTSQSLKLFGGCFTLPLF